MRIALCLLVFCLLLAHNTARNLKNTKSLSPQVTMRRVDQPTRDFRRNRRLRRRERLERRRNRRGECGAREIRRYRTFTAQCNNRGIPDQGAADTPMLILAGPLQVRINADLPNPRTISNLVHAEDAPKPNSRKLNSLLTFFGQFLDHTVTELTTRDGPGPANIPIPEDDPKLADGITEITFDRSLFLDGAPENLLSSYVDAISVYGITEADNALLREFQGGRMLAPDGLLPTNDQGEFIAGDIRVNENPNLASMHLLWVREHNRVAAEVAAEFRRFNDEQIFNLTRHIVAAELQAVVYYEFIPALTGSELPPYTGYDRNVVGRISNAFSTVGFRVGHTLLPSNITALRRNGREIVISLSDSFFNLSTLPEVGINRLMRGMSRQQASEIDAGITPEVRDFLRMESGSSIRFDLAALNIQRGRDHGVPPCNDLREAYGLPRFTRFNQMSDDRNVVRGLRSAYDRNIDIVDPWTCGVAEARLPGSSLGSLFQEIIRQEFQRLRDGDRFYFERTSPDYFRNDRIRSLPTVRRLIGNGNELGSIFRKIISDNTNIHLNELSANAFFLP